MSAGKKRQTMAKQARERAVREKRELKRERKRIRLLGETETETEFADESGDEAAETGLRLVADDGTVTEAAPAEDGPAPAAEEDELRGAHA
jgi:hypothetical protein